MSAPIEACTHSEAESGSPGLLGRSDAEMPLGHLQQLDVGFIGERHRPAESTRQRLDLVTSPASTAARAASSDQYQAMGNSSDRRRAGPSECNPEPTLGPGSIFAISDDAGRSCSSWIRNRRQRSRAIAQCGSDASEIHVPFLEHLDRATMAAVDRSGLRFHRDRPIVVDGNVESRGVDCVAQRAAIDHERSERRGKCGCDPICPGRSDGQDRAAGAASNRRCHVGVQSVTGNEAVAIADQLEFPETIVHVEPGVGGDHA